MAAIYQWFEEFTRYSYEYFIFVSDLGDALKYYGYDFDAGTYRLLGQKLYSGVTLASDNKNVFTTDLSGGNYGFYQTLWRGHAFHTVGFISQPGASNENTDILVLRNSSHIAGVGSTAFGHGALFTSYSKLDIPTVFTTSIAITPSNDYWGSCWDVFYEQDPNEVLEHGNAFLAESSTRFPSQAITTIKWNGATFVTVDQYYDSSLTNGCFNRFAGVLAGVNGAQARYANIDEDLLITNGGTTTLSASAVAAIITEYDYVMTAENDGGIRYVRTYTKGGTQKDELSLGAGTLSARTVFTVSPRTLRIWLYSATQIGLYAFSVDEDGLISTDGYIPNEQSITTGGFSKNQLTFLEGGMTITTNGYSGILSKLAEGWPLDEESGTRYGLLGLDNFDTEIGTVGFTTGLIDNAASFDGSSALVITPTKAEFQSGSNQSFSFFFKTSAIGAEQCLISKARIAAAYLGNDEAWDIGCSIAADGRVFFWLNVYENEPTFTPIILYAGSTPVSIDTWYFVYCEFDRINNTYSIRLNDNTWSDDFDPTDNLNINTYSDNALTIGRATSTSPQKYFTGAMDQLNWFYDVLDEDEQDYLYNDGNGIALPLDNYLLLETGDKITLEDGTGSLLLD